MMIRLAGRGPASALVCALALTACLPDDADPTVSLDQPSQGREGDPAAPGDPGDGSGSDPGGMEQPEGPFPGDPGRVLGCEGLDGLGLYEGRFACSLDGMDASGITTADISCADALANCQLNADANPGLAIWCTWNGALIFERGGGSCPGTGTGPSPGEDEARAALCQALFEYLPYCAAETPTEPQPGDCQPLVDRLLECQNSGLPPEACAPIRDAISECLGQGQPQPPVESPCAPLEQAFQECVSQTMDPLACEPIREALSECYSGGQPQPPVGPGLPAAGAGAAGLREPDDGSRGVLPHPRGAVAVLRRWPAAAAGGVALRADRAGVPGVPEPDDGPRWPASPSARRCPSATAGLSRSLRWSRAVSRWSRRSRTA
jgi:hypothetical protein